MLDMKLHRRLVLAVDTPDKDAALDLVRRTRGVVGTFKIGLELFTAHGPAIFHAIRKEDAEIFLDLKLHDIPNTVAGAVREAARHEVALLTVHALGGSTMMRVAQEALSAQTIPGGSQTQLLAVTVLTHHTPDDVTALGLSGTPDEVALRLAQSARDAGLFGCVCSPEEASNVRKKLGAGFAIVTPGIRAKDAPKGDQTRTATAYDAIRAGADYVVVGRPIRTAPDPVEAATRILDEIERGLAERAS